MEGSVGMKELSEYMFICQFKAAAERLLFFPVRGGIGTDILTINPEIKTITDPYNGETVVAMPSFRPDYALIHLNEADKLGIHEEIDPLGVRRMDFVRGKEQKQVMAEIMGGGNT